MRFMIMVKATEGTEAGVMPSEELLNQQVEFHEKLAAAGVLYDASGLKPTSKGWRVRSRDGRSEMTEGPFAEDGLIAGFTIIQVGSREEAIEWTMRYPLPGSVSGPAEIEVREFFALEDFEPVPAIDRFREIDALDRIARSVADARPDLAEATAPNGTVTILFTDIEGSTQLTERLGDREWMRVLQGHNAILREQVARHVGFEVKSQGDGFMLAFPSARDALRCAIDIQRALAVRDPGPAELRVRMGLHTGEPVREADDFYGKAVILAARIAAEAAGREIVVSSLVRELTESSGEFAFEQPSEVELKGLSGVHHVSAVRWRASDATIPP